MTDKPHEKERSDAQKRAEKTYREKRKSRPKIPASELSEEENELFQRVVVHFKTKKDALIAALRLLDKKLNK